MVREFILGGSKITADGDCNHEIKRRLLLGRRVMTNLDNILKRRDSTLLTKLHLVEASFSSGHGWMWKLDYKESWAPKNWCFWTVVLEKTLESHLNSKEFKPVNPKEINPEYSLEGQMVKLKLQYFGHLMQRTDSLEKTVMLGKTEGRRRRGWQDETAGCHHWLNAHEFEQALGVGDGQGSLAWHKELDTTERLKWTELTLR